MIYKIILIVLIVLCFILGFFDNELIFLLIPPTFVGYMLIKGFEKVDYIFKEIEKEFDCIEKRMKKFEEKDDKTK